MKIAVYVLMITKSFPYYHPKKGKPTDFKNKILSGEKIHTIRGNYGLWKKRIEKVLDGKAVISLRQWTGKPRHSKQVEIKRLTKDDGVGIQKLVFGRNNIYSPRVLGKVLFILGLCSNDGLSIYQFTEWFKPYDLSEPMALIHFTPFRY